VATRSRWPLLRNVVAETLRASFEPQLVNQLPLPADPATLFEMLCLVRVLKSLEPEPEVIRWLDVDAGGNTIRTPGLTCHFQYTINREVMLESSEFSPGLRTAIARHNVGLPQRVDALVLFDKTRRGFRGLLIEVKSGSQRYDASLHQLKCYRAALASTIQGPLIVWGITEEGDAAHWIAQESPQVPAQALDDLWLFSPASAISTALAGLRLEQPRTGSYMS
jgi:hypothetical protein